MLANIPGNNKKVLQSIPEKDRRSGVKDKYLLGDLPEEQVPGVLWKIEDDALGFNVSIKN